MKYTFFSLVILTTIFGCSKKDSTPNTNNNTVTPPNTNSTYYIEGKVDGTNVRAEQIPIGMPDSMYTYYQASAPLISMSKFVSLATGNLQGWTVAVYYNLDAMVVPHTYMNGVDNIVLGYTPAGGSPILMLWIPRILLPA